jgi:hypothetical protein
MAENKPPRIKNTLLPYLSAKRPTTPDLTAPTTVASEVKMPIETGSKPMIARNIVLETPIKSITTRLFPRAGMSRRRFLLSLTGILNSFFRIDKIATARN